MIDEIIEKFNLRYADAEVIIKDIMTVPLQTHQFSTAAAGIDENVGHGFPLDRSLFQRFDNVGNLLRLEVVRLMLRHFGRRGFRGGISYHKLGQSKYSALGMKGQYFEAPDQETMNTLKQRIAKKVGHSPCADKTVIL